MWRHVILVHIRMWNGWPTSAILRWSACRMQMLPSLSLHQLKAMWNLWNHPEAVTGLAASAGYHILVSGSRDRTAIVWDLSRFTFIRQLTGHNAPLAAIDINNLMGDIATCSGTWLHLWSINGDPLASVNTLVGQIGHSQHIFCVCFSQFNKWDPMNVILDT